MKNSIFALVPVLLLGAAEAADFEAVAPCNQTGMKCVVGFRACSDYFGAMPSSSTLPKMVSNCSEFYNPPAETRKNEPTFLFKTVNEVVAKKIDGYYCGINASRRGPDFHQPFQLPVCDILDGESSAPKRGKSSSCGAIRSGSAIPGGYSVSGDASVNKAISSWKADIEKCKGDPISSSKCDQFGSTSMSSGTTLLSLRDPSSTSDSVWKQYFANAYSEAKKCSEKSSNPNCAGLTIQRVGTQASIQNPPDSKENAYMRGARVRALKCAKQQLFSKIRNHGKFEVSKECEPLAMDLAGFYQKGVEISDQFSEKVKTDYCSHKELASVNLCTDAPQVGTRQDSKHWISACEIYGIRHGLEAAYANLVACQVAVNGEEEFKKRITTAEATQDFTKRLQGLINVCFKMAKDECNSEECGKKVFTRCYRDRVDTFYRDYMNSRFQGCDLSSLSGKNGFPFPPFKSAPFAFFGSLGFFPFGLFSRHRRRVFSAVILAILSIGGACDDDPPPSPVIICVLSDGMPVETEQGIFINPNSKGYLLAKHCCDFNPPEFRYPSDYQLTAFWFNTMKTDNQEITDAQNRRHQWENYMRNNLPVFAKEDPPEDKTENGHELKCPKPVKTVDVPDAAVIGAGMINSIISASQGLESKVGGAKAVSNDEADKTGSFAQGSGTNSAATSGGINPLKKSDKPNKGPDFKVPGLKTAGNAGSGSGSGSNDPFMMGQGHTDSGTAEQTAGAQNAAEAQKNDALYAGGGGGHGGGSTEGGYGSSDNGIEGGENTPQSMDFENQQGAINPNGSEDPEDYFTRTGLDENLFKKVEKRYRNKSMKWHQQDAAALRWSKQDEKLP